MLSSLATSSERRPLPSTTPLIQTLHSYVIKMQPLWADANRITLRYAVMGANGARLDFARVMPNGPNTTGPAPRLTDDQGTEFPWLATRSQFDFDPEEPQTPEVGKAVVPWFSVDFDAAGLRGNPAQLNLHLILAPLLLSPPTPTEAIVLPTLMSATFDFSMPFDGARRVLEVGQTAMVDGVGMVLERVVVSRYETRAMLRVLPPAQDTIRTATLSVGDWDSHNPRMRTRGPTVVECFQLPREQQACSFYLPLLDQQGEWVLTVQGLNGKPSEGTIGVWTFHFTVPPFSK
jgi:hypothetical protein